MSGFVACRICGRKVAYTTPEDAERILPGFNRVHEHGRAFRIWAKTRYARVIAGTLLPLCIAIAFGHPWTYFVPGLTLALAYEAGRNDPRAGE